MAGTWFGFITVPEDPDPPDWSPLVVAPVVVFGYICGIVWEKRRGGGTSGAR